MNNARDVTDVARGLHKIAELSAEVIVEEPENSDADEQEILNISDFCRNRERGLSAFDRVKSLCKSLSLPAQTTVAEL